MLLPPVGTPTCDKQWIMGNAGDEGGCNMASEWLISAKIGKLLASDRFDKDSIVRRELSLSQAFCLLWQNEQTGDVAGRQRPNAMTDTATAAVLLDLYALEKIDLEKEIKHWMDRKRQTVMVKVSTSRAILVSAVCLSQILCERLSKIQYI